MVRFDKLPSWSSNPHEHYVPILYEGEIVGFCQPTYVARILATLNDDEKLRKALKLACYDLISRAGGNRTEVEDLVQKYLARVTRPKQGTAAIAHYLRERQAELDLTEGEFTKFCYTFRLAASDLAKIYNGEELESRLLIPLSRILGMTVDELIAVWQGSESEM
ncbi:hypothetical protein OsccyDRAFT_1893 [Leptolyngbyaceae cyanobacterium JSC-12]|nr:hypothetical protein OsccyDRAFT_1893 [Leptolyngbyaceae cyanobacterium JSC-12]